MSRIVLARRQHERVRVRIGGVVVWVHYDIRLYHDGTVDRIRLVFEAPPEVEVLRKELVPADELAADPLSRE